MIMIGCGGESGVQNTDSIIGDAIALGGAAGIVLYMTGSMTLRTTFESPAVFATFGINIIAIILSYIYSVIIFPSSYSAVGDWTKTENVPYVIYLGIVPGIVGHLLANFSTKYLNGITLVTLFNLEAFFGIVIGIIFHVQVVPGPLVWTGGAILICAAIAVGILDIKEQETKTAAKANSDIG
jgi:drug/metabolite transporter (DMT)-like permease